MLPVLTEISLETAGEWIITFAKIREHRLVRQNDRTPVSIGAAMLHLMNKRDGLRTVAGILRGRFDERNESRRIGENRQRVYFESLPVDVAESTQVNVNEILESLDLRERTIVEARIAGHTNREISQQLNLTEQRIGQILTAIQEKIQNSL